MNSCGKKLQEVFRWRVLLRTPKLCWAPPLPKSPPQVLRDHFCNYKDFYGGGLPKRLHSRVNKEIPVRITDWKLTESGRKSQSWSLLLAWASVPRPSPPSFHPLEAPASLTAFLPPALSLLALTVLLPSNPRIPLSPLCFLSLSVFTASAFVFPSSHFPGFSSSASLNIY